MPPKRRDGRRVRGSDGKLYDPRKQKDNGHRAHENRVQTVLRRSRWRASGFLHGLFGAFVWMLMNLAVRPTRKTGQVLWAALRYLGGCLGSLVGRGNNRRTIRRRRRN